MNASTSTAASAAVVGASTSSSLDDKNDAQSSQQQPGYRYGSVAMKARSYDQLPHTYKFTKDMELLYTSSNSTRSPTKGMDQSGPPSDGDPAVDDTSVVFNIGAHILLYRDVHDSMGFHADNDQGESYILTTILSQQHGQDIIIKPKKPILPFNHNHNSESQPLNIADVRSKRILNYI